MLYPADGDVYYSVRQFTDYGKLSGRKLEDLQAGASGRVAVDTLEDSKKKDPFDFCPLENPLKKANLPGNLIGVLVVLAGISNVRRW